MCHKPLTAQSSKRRLKVSFIHLTRMNLEGQGHRSGAFNNVKKKSRPISRVLSWTVIHLGRTSPCASSNLPGDRAGNTPVSRTLSPYLILLRVGFTVPLLLPGARCALTAPFHPYRGLGRNRTRGGIFSVALSVGSHLPGVTWHPALRSPDFPPPCPIRAKAATVQPTSGLMLPKLTR